MIYKKFFIQILIRVVLLALSCILFAFLVYRIEGEHYFLLAGTGLIILFEIFLLVRYVNRSNSDLALFFNSIQGKDRSVYFPPESQPDDKNLRKALNRMISLINSVEAENEKRRIYLQTLIDQIDIGLISFDDEGNIEFCNQTFKNMFHLIDVKHIRELEKIQVGFSDLLIELSPRTPMLKKMVIPHSSEIRGPEIVHLSIKGNIIRSDDQTRKIISCHNIIHELESNELDSWQKLIRVLTHEIMNSISPITSLSHKIASRFKINNGQDIISAGQVNDEMISKSVEGLNTIEETGKGLLEFVKKYRSLTLIPPPKPESFPVQHLFKGIKTLFEEECKSADISFMTDVSPENLEVLADESQLEKVMINLVKNAIEAVRENMNKKVSLMASVREMERVRIQVIDNGIGIPSENMDYVFTPFFTTKENGSGIGLSLSRQILRMNGGSISVSSIPGKETVFSIIL
jgi:nitrogen fixation/metabolism regulation signal transduction histidine kinase